MHFCVLRSFVLDKLPLSSFADFGVVDSLAALQGLLGIPVRVALVWIHSATASTVSFFLLLQVSLFAAFATMSFCFFLGGPPLFLSALLCFFFGV